MDMEILKFKTHNIILLFFTIGFFILTSCRKDAEVKLPESNPKPVVAGFISPQDSFITIRLTPSIPLFRKNQTSPETEIRDALVKISQDGNSVIIPYFKDSVGYQISSTQFQIMAGKSYSLEIKLSSGEVLMSNTMVPTATVSDFLLTAQKNRVDSSSFGIRHEILFNLKWQDPPELDNYYRILIYSLESNFTQANDTIAMVFADEFVADQAKDGQILDKTISTSIFSDNLTLMSDKIYLVYLINCNKDYYNYHRDLARFDDLNPFTERKINFSNIEGGIGCFGAHYTILKKTKI